MDLNHEYTAHQRSLMRAEVADSDSERVARLAAASRIAGRISDFQHGLGAAAACAWSRAQFLNSAQIRANTETLA